MGLDHNGLVSSSRDSGPESAPAQSCGAVSAHEQTQVTVFSVVDVLKVLALDDFLHDVVGVNSSVVHP